MRADDDLATEFAGLRGYLLSLAYRLTGSVTDAEDAVQESWLRLAGLTAGQRGELRDLRAWLTTVLGRICLDRLRSAAKRRETYPGQWLPEPVVTPLATTSREDPLDAAVRDESLRMAAVVVLEKLTPEQRVAFVLHDGFGVPFTEIADILGCSSDAARQHGSRGRRTVAEADPPARADRDVQWEVLERFMTAVRAGDIHAIAQVLHPDVVLIGDGGGKARTARQVITGADRIMRFIQGLLDMYGVETLSGMTPVLVNGDLGLYVPATPGGDRHRDLDNHVQAIAIRDGRVVTLYDIANPDKLTTLR